MVTALKNVEDLEKLKRSDGYLSMSCVRGWQLKFALTSMVITATSLNSNTHIDSPLHFHHGRLCDFPIMWSPLNWPVTCQWDVKPTNWTHSNSNNCSVIIPIARRKIEAVDFGGDDGDGYCDDDDDILTAVYVQETHRGILFASSQATVAVLVTCTNHCLLQQHLPAALCIPGHQVCTLLYRSKTSFSVIWDVVVAVYSCSSLWQGKTKITSRVGNNWWGGIYFGWLLLEFSVNKFSFITIMS